jgi:predicted small secreted protein
MALVFISHAHGDEVLARRVSVLLRDGLGLRPDELFVSSQGGRGVAPAASIRGEIVKALSAATALVVIVTPASAGSPWVWMETGIRLGRPDTSNPFFLVPSERFVKQRPLEPFADLRCICLDQEDDLHEFLAAMGRALGLAPRDVLDYAPALAELTRAARAAYSHLGQRRSQALAWLRHHVAALLLGVAIAGAALLYGHALLRSAQADNENLRDTIAGLNDQLANVQGRYVEAMNEELSRTASRFLVLKGVVTSGQEPVAGARVVASQLSDPPDDCQEPVCTAARTTSDGEFRLELARIQAQNGEDVLLTVHAPGFQEFTKNLRVDVRAMDVGLPAHKVALRRTGTTGGHQ